MPTLLAISVALLLGSNASAECHAAPEQSMEVVTFNAWGLPAPIAKKRKARMPRIARWIDDQGFDVVGLQEVWRGALPLMSLDRLFTPPKSGGDSGLALVSDHPVRNGGISHFSTARGIERLKRKGWQTSTVDVDGFGALHVWNTHLQAQEGEAQAVVRGEQVREILDRAAVTDGPMVIMGDFNLYPGLDEDRVTHERMLAAGFVDAASATGVHDSTYDSPTETGRFDRVYVRGGERCLGASAVEVLHPVVEGERLSDHLPVRATLSW